jgi:transglutaminase-like putative cysteine protease
MISVIPSLYTAKNGYNTIMAVPILKEPPITSRDAFIPYLMTALNMLAPTIAAYPILAPHVFLVSVFLILLGIPCSVYFRQRGYNRIVLNLVTTLPLLILTWMLVRSLPGLDIDWSNPLGSIIASESSLDQLDGMLHIFTVLAAGRALLLVTSADLLQTPLPGISIFLLAVITHPELDRAPATMLCLVVLFITSAYLFSHEQHQQWFSIHTPPRIQRQLLVWTLIFALVLTPLVLVIGAMLQPFNMMSVTSRMGRRHSVLGGLMGRGGQVRVFLEPTLEVGGSNWPTGKQQVMTVEVNKNTPPNLLWRGATYETYKGGHWESAQLVSMASSSFGKIGVEKNRGWTLSPAGPGMKEVELQPEPTGDPGIVQAIAEGKLDPRTALFTQRIDFLAQTKSYGESDSESDSVVPVYGAYQINRVRSSELVFRNPAVGYDGSILLNNVIAMGPSFNYEVESIVKPLPTTLQLDQPLPYEESDVSLKEHFAPYLQMPEGEISKRIKQIAIEILAKRNINMTARDFDKVHQLELELNSHYRYTLKPKPPPKGEDPIIDFLDRQKQGYCNYFSGSMVMLCRSVGVPARFVVGFATGDIDERVKDPDIIRYRVNASHAHSWVEVYLKGYGWYTMDPTAGSRLAPTVWGTAWDSVTRVFEQVKGWVASWTAAFRASLKVRITSIIVLALLLALGITLIIAFRDRPPEFPRNVLTPEEARKTVLACYRRMHRWLERWGVHKPEGCTASEFEQLFRQLNPAMGEPVRDLIDLYIRQQYGGVTPEDTDARRAITRMHELWAVAKTERKRLYAPTETEA